MPYRARPGIETRGCLPGRIPRLYPSSRAPSAQTLKKGRTAAGGSRWSAAERRQGRGNHNSALAELGLILCAVSQSVLYREWETGLGCGAAINRRRALEAAPSRPPTRAASSLLSLAVGAVHFGGGESEGRLCRVPRLRVLLGLAGPWPRARHEPELGPHGEAVSRHEA